MYHFTTNLRTLVKMELTYDQIDMIHIQSVTKKLVCSVNLLKTFYSFYQKLKFPKEQLAYFIV